MKKIMIADPSKASLVMTSEVFKDNYPGISVHVAKTSHEALEIAKSQINFDAFIIDYDLPDVDGAKTAYLLKQVSKTPILITAFDRKEVCDSIDTTLSKFDDCRSWLRKPVNPEIVMAVAQRYCEGKIRSQKRIPCQLKGLAEILFEIKEKVIVSVSEKKEKNKSKSKIKVKTAKKNEKKPTKKTTYKTHKIKFNFLVSIDDISINGVRLKPLRYEQDDPKQWSDLLQILHFVKEGDSIVVKTQMPEHVELGEQIEVSKIASYRNSLSKTSENLKVNKANKAESKGEVTNLLPNELEGRVAWCNTNSGEWMLGVEFKEALRSIKLFQGVVGQKTKQQRSHQTQTSLRLSRN